MYRRTLPHDAEPLQRDYVFVVYPYTKVRFHGHGARCGETQEQTERRCSIDCHDLRFAEPGMWLAKHP